jgi:hypothetical protein
MKYSSSLKTLAVLAGAVMLASCGGGDDNEAGAPVALNVAPAEVGWKVGAGAPSCATGALSEVFINGGVGPYTIQNPAKTIVTVPDKVQNRGDSFVLNFTGNCTQDEGIVLTVVDAMKNQVTVTVRNLMDAAT